MLRYNCVRSDEGKGRVQTKQHFNRSGVDLFWGALPPSEHMLHLYADQAQLLDLLVGFVAGGLAGGESVLLLATPGHLDAVAARLADRDIDLRGARRRDHYLTMDVDEALGRFMVDGWPDEHRFEAFVSQLVERASAGGQRPVRAFGELVAVLWERGQGDAMVRLEQLWDRLCRRLCLPLFCAYPRAGFGQDDATTLREVCAAHNRILHA